MLTNQRQGDHRVRPTVMDFGFASIKGYGLMIGIAIPIVFWIVGREARRTGLGALDEARVALFFWIAGAIYLGGKIAFVMGYPAQYESLLETEGLPGLLREGFVYFGSVVLGVPVTFYALRRYGIPLGRGIDTLAYALPIGHGFGRLGCFLSGCCYGSRCEEPWAVTFTAGQGLNGIPLHPVQLYEACGSFLIFLVLWLYVRHHYRFPGQVMIGYLCLYSVLRLVTETFRGDGNPIWVGDDHVHPLGHPPGGLTQAQVIAIGMLLVLVPLYLHRLRAARARAS